MGFCGPAGKWTPGLGYGRGGGYGRCRWPGGGRGRGWRNRYYAPDVQDLTEPGRKKGFRRFAGVWEPEDQLNYLKNYAANLEEELKAIGAQIEEMEKQRADL
jgi:hypothetical protein